MQDSGAGGSTDEEESAKNNNNSRRYVPIDYLKNRVDPTFDIGKKVNIT